MKKILYPIGLALAVVFGMVIGSYIAPLHRKSSVLSEGDSAKNLTPFEKLQTILDLVQMNYVDTVDVDSLVENSIPTVLSNLDPHSVYLANLDKQIANDDLDGSFSGIGVQFSIEDDTVMVSNVISGGPSAKMGVRAGDRIVTVDGKNFTGKETTNEKVLKTLRGKKGSVVKLGIKRVGSKNLIAINITRDDISVSSIDIAYMIKPGIGFVRVNKFGETTYQEFVSSLVNLQKQGAKRFIVDLRENSGGYLEAAIAMINEFLKKDQMIVYTKGRLGKEDSYADGSGRFQNVPITVLINEWSASASEIFAGAIQDNDRGQIVGRRSFGKGLVQQQFHIDANSDVRLTIARYYTPSGRCIQKPYGKDRDYVDEIMERYNNGEMEDPSKYQHSDKEQKFKTSSGRIVYGGGGITPDVFVGVSNEGNNSYFRSLNDNALYDFVFYYVDKNRTTLSKFKTLEELVAYLKTQGLEYKLAEYARDKKSIKMNPTMLAESKSVICNRLNACIARSFFGDKGFFSILNETDPTVKKALDINLEK